jgi:hypothetical protein
MAPLLGSTADVRRHQVEPDDGKGCDGDSATGVVAEKLVWGISRKEEALLSE